MNNSGINTVVMKDLERILADEEELQPMTGFSTRVMRTVREEATAKPPIAFPWSRFLPGVLLNLGLILGAAGWLVLGACVPSQMSPFPTDWLSDPQAQGLFWAGLILVGTCLMGWGVSRWVAPRQTLSF